MNSIQNRTKETKTNKTVHFSSLPLTFSQPNSETNIYNKNSTLRSCSIYTSYKFSPVQNSNTFHHQNYPKIQKYN